MDFSSPNGKKKVLYLIEKIKAIETDKKGISSRTKAKTFKVGKKEINIMKRKLEYP